MSNHFVITGVPKNWPVGQSPPSRLEITDLIKIEDQFSLFVQSLNKMQKTPSNLGTSHYQIGGIHGFPFAPWEGSGSQPVNGAPTNFNWNGYCTHGSVLFPTWHRPYLALFEQVLSTTAHDIAKGYPDKARWTAAADKLRLPFWDWVLRPVPPPEVLELKTVNILMPDGKKSPVNNPLVSYNFGGMEKQFPKAAPGQMRDWSTLPQTVRYPGYADPVGTLKKRLQATVTARRDNVEHLLYFVKSWEDFSNHTQSGRDTKASSLEAIHDGIHVLVGAGGHMNDPLVAAFDPIFFLHHCNVDRIFALWQSRNPSTWVSPGPARDGTWTIPMNSTEDANTKLTPFWSGTGADAYWTSSGARSWEGLGYTYPDFAGMNSVSTNLSAFSAAVTAKFQQAHNAEQPTPGKFFFPQTFLRSVVPDASAPAASAPAPAPQAKGVANKSAQPQDVVQDVTDKAQAVLSGLFKAADSAAHSAGIKIPGDQHLHQQNTALTVSPTGATVDPTKGFLDWTARIRFKKFELRESFAVHIFLKEPPADPMEWIGCDGYVGSHYAFVNTMIEQCANCVGRAETIDEGFVQLNSAIARLSGLKSFDTEVVEPYLKKEMKWRVQKADLKTPIATSELTSLEVSILSAQLSMEPNAQVPTQGRVNHHPHITLGRQGGHGPI